jgi:hypothetical protein
MRIKSESGGQPATAVYELKTGSATLIGAVDEIKRTRFDLDFSPAFDEPNRVRRRNAKDLAG